MSRGGRRPGGGRKPLPPEQRRIVLSCRVKPETFDAICREAGQGSIGRLLDKIFENTALHFFNLGLNARKEESK